MASNASCGGAESCCPLLPQHADFPALQAATIAEALAAGRCDFGFLHVKAVDDTGHDRAAASKATLPLLRSSSAITS